jgi:antitoxin HicB
MIPAKYRIHIICPEENDCYPVALPELATSRQHYFTHSDTYEEALTDA